MLLLWLGLAIVATLAYHLVLKLTPAGVNPFLSLTVTYVIVTTAFASLYAVMSGGAPLRESLQALNWTAVALGVAIVGLDFGFLMLYRSGFDVSLGQLVTQSAAALLLLLVGIAYFQERLSPANVAGIALCVVGLWLVSRR